MELLNRIVLLCCLLLPLSSDAQFFRASFAVLGNLNNGKYNFIEKQGDYNIRNNNFNLGLSINASLYPIKEDNWYLLLGVRMNTTEASLSTVRPVTRIWTAASPISWTYRWRAITIPFYVGKTIAPFAYNEFNMDVYGGISYGVISGVMSHYEVGHNYIDDVFDRRRLMTIDIGLSFAPILSLPGLGIGFVFAYNADATKDVRGGAMNSQGQQEYYYKFNRRFNNYMLLIQYSIGRKARLERKNTNFDCFRI